MTGQAEITAEIAAIHTDYHRAGVEESQPRLNYPPYRSSLFRHPTNELHHADPKPSSCGRRVSGRATLTRSMRI